jgi:hypothetical protein
MESETKKVNESKRTFRVLWAAKVEVVRHNNGQRWLRFTRLHSEKCRCSSRNVRQSPTVDLLQVDTVGPDPVHTAPSPLPFGSWSGGCVLGADLANPMSHVSASLCQRHAVSRASTQGEGKGELSTTVRR